MKEFNKVEISDREKSIYETLGWCLTFAIPLMVFFLTLPVEAHWYHVILSAGYFLITLILLQKYLYDMFWERDLCFTYKKTYHMLKEAKQEFLKESTIKLFIHTSVAIRYSNLVFVIDMLKKDRSWWAYIPGGNNYSCGWTGGIMSKYYSRKVRHILMERVGLDKKN